MNKRIFKIIAFVIIQAFVVLDFTWCGAGEVVVNSHGRIKKDILAPKVAISIDSFRSVFSKYPRKSTTVFFKKNSPKNNATENNVFERWMANLLNKINGNSTNLITWSKYWDMIFFGRKIENRYLRYLTASLPVFLIVVLPVPVIAVLIAWLKHKRKDLISQLEKDTSWFPSEVIYSGNSGFVKDIRLLKEEVITGHRYPEQYFADRPVVIFTHGYRAINFSGILRQRSMSFCAGEGLIMSRC